MERRHRKEKYTFHSGSKIKSDNLFVQLFSHTHTQKKQNITQRLSEEKDEFYFLTSLTLELNYSSGN